MDSQRQISWAGSRIHYIFPSPIAQGTLLAICPNCRGHLPTSPARFDAHVLYSAHIVRVALFIPAFWPWDPKGLPRLDLGMVRVGYPGWNLGFPILYLGGNDQNIRGSYF